MVADLSSDGHRAWAPVGHGVRLTHRVPPAGSTAPRQMVARSGILPAGIMRYYHPPAADLAKRLG